MAKTRTGFVEGDARDLKGNAHESFSKGQKEHVEKMGKVVGKESAGKIGHYAESTGGGTPIPAGEKLADHPEAKRVQQPRDEEGKFTYNSVNLKTLKYGPSRGVTVPPFMKGVTITYAKEKVTSTTVSNGKVYKNNINMTGEEFLTKMQEYKEKEGGFLGIVNARIESKRGRRTKEEKSMIQNREEGFAANKTTATTSFRGFPTIQSYTMKLQVYSKNFKQKANVVGPMTQKAFNKKNNGQNINPVGNKPVNNKPNNNNVNNNGVNNNGVNKTSDGTQPKQYNLETAKNNPEKFIEENYDEFDKLLQAAESKGIKSNQIDINGIVAAIANGEVTSIDDLIKDIENM